MDEDTGPPAPTRRHLIAGIAGGTVALAGCAGGDNGNESDTGDGNSSGRNEGNTTENGNSTGNGTTGGNETGSEPGDAELDAPSLAGDASVPVLGDPDADVTLEVYEDFLCPHCKRYNAQFFGDIERAYLDADEIRYEHRTFPVVHQRHSVEAANAAYAVLDEHGNAAFWAYKSRLFDRQSEIRGAAPAIYADIAAAMGYDGDPIQSAAVEGTYSDWVDRDQSRGQRLGVPATPTFVVNGELVSTQREDTFRDIVDRTMDRLDAALDGDTGGDDTESGEGSQY